MTKQQAKTLIAELIERNYDPTISRNADDYTVSVSSVQGVTTAQLQQVEGALNVSARAMKVSFS